MKCRHAFTLVELLVSLALIIFIMAILSQAFVAALGTFRNLKAAGDMAEKLRATTQILQRDLAAQHFEGTKRLSNPNFWLNGPPQQGYFQIYQGSKGNFEGNDLDTIPSYICTNHSLAFAICLTGQQITNFLSASAPQTFLWQSQQPTFTGTAGAYEARYQIAVPPPPSPAPVPLPSYNYQWAEVAWFMQPSINPSTGLPDTTVTDPTAGAPNGQPLTLYTLYRRQRLACPGDTNVHTRGAGGDPFGFPMPVGIPYTSQYASCLELSCWGLASAAGSTGSLYFNSPADLTVPGRRLGNGPLTIAPAGQGNAYPYPYQFTTLAQDLQTLGISNPSLIGADIMLNDVVSFEVRMLPDLSAIPENAQFTALATVEPFVTLFDAPFTVAANPPYTYTAPYQADGKTPIPGMVFDTWTSTNDQFSNYSQWNVPFASQNPKALGTTIPLGGPIIQAIQVTIRIWDSKTNQTRQVSIVQAM
jgi:type II secretory pathway pseudopilin PulG